MMAPRAARLAGYTLVELLVVIGITALLIGILIPAVMKARAASVRMECQNNLKQLGLAMHNYVATHGGFPPGVSYSLGWKNGAPTGTIHSWSVYVLPWLDQQSLIAAYDFNKPFFANTDVISTPLSVFQCPATPDRNRAFTQEDWKPSKMFGIPAFSVYDPFLTSSAVTMAAGDYGTYWKLIDDWKVVFSYGPNAPDLVGVLSPAPYPSADATKALLAGGEIPFTAKSTLTGEITDGLSNTVLLIEDAGRPHFWKAGKPGPPDAVSEGSGWADPGAFLTLKGDIDSRCLMNCNNKSSIYSFHSGGANFAFADGTVRFLTNSTSLKTLVALLTARSGDLPGDDW